MKNYRKFNNECSESIIVLIHNDEIYIHHEGAMMEFGEFQRLGIFLLTWHCSDLEVVAIHSAIREIIAEQIGVKELPSEKLLAVSHKPLKIPDKKFKSMWASEHIINQTL